MRWHLAAVLAALLLAVPTAVFAQLPAMRDRPLSGAERVRLQALEGDIVRISSQRNTSAAAVRSIARKLGARLTTSDPQQILSLIDAKAVELARARTEIETLESQLETLDSMRLARAVQPLLEAAQAAIDEGELEQAEERLAAAAEQFGNARTNLEGQVSELALRQADITAQQATVRSSSFDFEGAASLFETAAGLVPEDQPLLKVKYLRSARTALANLSTGLAVPGIERLVTEMQRLVPRERYPAEWAQTQVHVVDDELSRLRQLASQEEQLIGYRKVILLLDELEALQTSDVWRVRVLINRTATLGYLAEITQEPSDRARALEAAQAAYALRGEASAGSRLLIVSRLAEQLIAAAPVADRSPARREAIGLLRSELEGADMITITALQTRDVLAKVIGDEARATKDPALFREEIALRDEAAERFPPVFQAPRAWMLLRSSSARNALAELSDPSDPVLLLEAADLRVEATRLYLSVPGGPSEYQKRLAVLGCVGAMWSWVDIFMRTGDATLLEEVEACGVLTEPNIGLPSVEPKFQQDFWRLRAEALEAWGADTAAALNAYRRAEAIDVPAERREPDAEARIKSGLARLTVAGPDGQPR